MNGMFEFRDKNENIIAMCEHFAVFHALKDFFISRGYTVTYSRDVARYYVMENDN